MLKKFLDAIDLYGLEYSFREHSDTKFHTIQSGFFSLLSLIAIFVICIMFGKEIFVNKIPSVNNGEKLISVENSELEVSRIPILLYFENITDFSVLDYKNYLDIELVEIIYEKDGTYIVKDPRELSLSTCDIKNFDPVYNLNSTFDYSYYLCPEFDNVTVKNNYDDLDSKSLLIQISQCSKAKNPDCKDIFKDAERFNIWTFFAKHFIDSEDYDNPLSFQMISKISRISQKTFIGSSLIINKNSIETDIGRLMDDYKKQTYLSISELEQSFSLKSENKYDPMVFRLGISTTKLSNIVTRRYMKYQELLSRIGGITNAILIMGYLITYNFNFFSYKNEIHKELFSITKEYDAEQLGTSNNIIKLHDQDQLTKKIEINENNLIQNSSSNIKITSKFTIKNLLSGTLMEKPKLNILKEDVLTVNEIKSIIKNSVPNDVVLPSSKEKEFLKVEDFKTFLDNLSSNVNNVIDENNSILRGEKKKKISENLLKLINIQQKENNEEDYFSYFYSKFCCCRSVNSTKDKIFNKSLSFYSSVKSTFITNVLLKNENLEM